MQTTDNLFEQGQFLKKHLLLYWCYLGGGRQCSKLSFLFLIPKEFLFIYLF